MLGVNINDDLQPFTDLILSGKKTIETRNKNTLKSLVGQSVGLIKTGKNKQAMLVGIVLFHPPKVYKTKSEFRKDKNKHRIKNDSKYDFNQTIKYGYRISVVFKFKYPQPIHSKGIVFRQI